MDTEYKLYNQIFVIEPFIFATSAEYRVAFFH